MVKTKDVKPLTKEVEKEKEPASKEVPVERQKKVSYFVWNFVNPTYMVDWVQFNKDEQVRITDSNKKAIDYMVSQKLWQIKEKYVVIE